MQFARNENMEKQRYDEQLKKTNLSPTLTRIGAEAPNKLTLLK